MHGASYLATTRHVASHAVTSHFGSAEGRKGVIDAPDGTNGLAVASLALGITPAGAGIPAVVLGIVALRRVTETGQRGKAQAIAGIVLGAVWAVLLAMVMFVGLPSGEATRDASGRIVAAGDIPIGSLRAGDCIKEYAAGSSLTELHGVPCTESHVAEVVGEFEPPEDRRGLFFVEEVANKSCKEMFLTYAPIVEDDPPRIWFIERYDGGQATVVCLWYHEQTRTGSLRV